MCASPFVRASLSSACLARAELMRDSKSRLARPSSVARFSVSARLDVTSAWSAASRDTFSSACARSACTLASWAFAASRSAWAVFARAAFASSDTESSPAREVAARLRSRMTSSADSMRSTAPEAWRCWRVSSPALAPSWRIFSCSASAAASAFEISARFASSSAATASSRAVAAACFSCSWRKSSTASLSFKSESSAESPI